MLRASSLGLRLRHTSSAASQCSTSRTSTSTIFSHPQTESVNPSASRAVKHAKVARSAVAREQPPHTSASAASGGAEASQPMPPIQRIKVSTWVQRPAPERALPEDDMLQLVGRLPVVLKHRVPRQLRPATGHRSSQQLGDPTRRRSANQPNHGNIPLFDEVFNEKRANSSSSGQSISQLPRDLLQCSIPKSGIALASRGKSTLHTEMFAGELANPRAELIDILARTSSLDDAWGAYHALLSLPPDPNTSAHAPHIPHAHLHRLAQMLATTRPRTRTAFLRLLAVLSTLQRAGGHVRTFEWNALINYAGKGWRKLRAQDFQNAMDVYEDFEQRAPPGTALASWHGPPLADPDPGVDAGPELPREMREALGVPGAEAPTEPDIITYTTLVDVAARLGFTPALQHAMQLLKQSGLAPTRITHLALLRYFTRRNELSSVRDTLAKMRRAGHDIGLDGLNAVMWAFAYNRRLDVAGGIYRILRNGVVPESADAQKELEETRIRLEEIEGIAIPEGLIPDAITYTIFIQGLAYCGELGPALQVFIDMLTSRDQSAVKITSPKDYTSGASPEDHKATPEPPNFTPTLPIFRALFIGFVRHGQPSVSAFQQADCPSLTTRLSAIRAGADASAQDWNQDQLYLLFKSFLALPADARPSERVIYWVLIAFDKVSEHNEETLRTVYGLLERRFGGGWGGRIARFRGSIFKDGADECMVDEDVAQ